MAQGGAIRKGQERGQVSADEVAIREVSLGGSDGTQATVECEQCYGHALPERVCLRWSLASVI